MKVFKVTQKGDSKSHCFVAALDYAQAVAKLVNQSNFEFMYGSGFTIEVTNETFID